jgi:uncharacterized protein YjbJ (UPF0337 family)
LTTRRPRAVITPAGVSAAWSAGKETANVSTEKECDMSGEDKMNNKMEELGGKAKEALGNATDDRDLQAAGQKDQTKSNLKQAGEKVKDAFK